MQVGGWYASAHFCVRLGVRMSSIKGERRETSTYCTICVSCSIQSRLGIFDYSLSLSLALWIFHVLYHVVFQCLPRIPVSRRFAAEMLSAVLCSVPPCIMLGPYQSRWLTVGRRLKPYLSNLRDKRTHCISNIRNTLERRRESGDARHTVQPQTV